MEEQLGKIVNELGYRLKEFDMDNAYDLIAWEFQGYANDFLQTYENEPIKQYGRGVQVFFKFVEKDASLLGEKDAHALSAWAQPLNGTDGFHYGIFVSMAILRGIVDLFTAMAAGPDAFSKGDTGKAATEKFESYIYPHTAASLVFIFLHEWMHIFHAHIPFLYGEKDLNTSRKELLPLHLIKPTPVSDLESSKNRLRIHRCMEIDADLFAVGIIVELLSMKNRYYMITNISTSLIYLANRLLLLQGYWNNGGGLFHKKNIIP